EAFGTVDAHARAAPQADAQEVIESREVIHVRVRDEHVAHAQELAGGKRHDVAGVEKERAAQELEIDVDARVAERRVDELRLEDGTHAALARRPERLAAPGGVRSGA